MKPMSLFFAGMLFVAIIVSGTGWYGSLVNDYASLGATAKIDVAEVGHEDIITQLNQTQQTMESGIKESIQGIPILGGTSIWVFSVFQMLKAFMLSLWKALTIGTSLITGIDELIPKPYGIDPTIRGLIYLSMVMLFIGSVVYVLIGRRVT